MEVWDRSTAVNPSSPSDQAQRGPAPKPLFELWAPSHFGRLQLSSSGLLAVAALMGDVHVRTCFVTQYCIHFRRESFVKAVFWNMKCLPVLWEIYHFQLPYLKSYMSVVVRTACSSGFVNLAFHQAHTYTNTHMCTHTHTHTHTHTLSSSNVGMAAPFPLLHWPKSSCPTRHTPHTRHSRQLPLAFPWLPSNTLQDVHSDWNLGHWGPPGGC